MKKLILQSGTVLYVGENARENQTLVDTYMDTEYIWFHVKDFPSCHVILEHVHPTQDDIHEAALICRNHTKYRFLKHAKVSYTPCSNVLPTDVPGRVIFISNKKVHHIIPLTPK